MPAYPSEPLSGASPAAFTWLTGSWHARLGDDQVEEHWSPLRANTLVATFRWVRGDGTVRFYEIEVLEQVGAHVHLRIKHFDPGLIGWEEKDTPHEFVLVEIDERGAVFLELDRPEPRWAVYRRHGGDRLSAYFTRDEKPDPDPGVFEFVRC